MKVSFVCGINADGGLFPRAQVKWPLKISLKKFISSWIARYFIFFRSNIFKRKNLFELIFSELLIVIT